MDWDKAYDNRAHVKNAEEILNRWAAEAAGFREEMLALTRAELDIPYGDRERERIDLFYPENEPAALVVFVHGGYWRALDKSYFSHFAIGPLSCGWAVASIQYNLAPQARISFITTQVRNALVAVAERLEGDIYMIGHSAGGHLVTRLLCDDVALPEAVRQRIKHTVSVSGLHDLEPLLKTQMNIDLKLDRAEARAESPVNHKTHSNGRLTCWVGADELPEFIRQNELLQESWKESGLIIKVDREPGKNHFTVIEDLTNSNSRLTRTLLEKGA